VCWYYDLTLTVSRTFAKALRRPSQTMKINMYLSFESARVFSIFLDLVTNGARYDLSEVIDVINFLNKYDSPLGLTTIALEMEVAVWRRTVPPERGFLIAAILRSDKVAEASLQVGADQRWELQDDSLPGSAKAGQHRLDPRSWSLELWNTWGLNVMTLH
jgi:hypothetical protein